MRYGQMPQDHPDEPEPLVQGARQTPDLNEPKGCFLGKEPANTGTSPRGRPYITAFAPLLDRIDITGAIITADALHTQHRHADYLRGRGAHYVLTVKGNQPNLHRQLRALPWAQIPAVDLTCDKGHGRIESRSLKLTAVPAGIGFPHAHLAIQLTRRRRSPTSRKWHTETIYAITDLTCNQIRAAHLAGTIRGHWRSRCDMKSHWVSEITEMEGRVIDG